MVVAGAFALPTGIGHQQLPDYCQNDRAQKKPGDPVGKGPADNSDQDELALAIQSLSDVNERP